MPKNNHVAILLDVNAIPKRKPHTDPSPNKSVEIKQEPGLTVGDQVDGPAGIKSGKTSLDKRTPLLNVSTESFDLPEDHPQDETDITTMYAPETIKFVTELVLMQVCQQALDKEGQFNFSRIMWTFKIFNSSVELNSLTGKKFRPFDIESFESFVRHLGTYLNPPTPVLDINNPNHPKSKSDATINRIEFVSTVIKTVLSDLSWPDPLINEEETGQSSGTKNAIYAFLRVPRNTPELYDFFPSEPLPTSQSFKNGLLPKCFSKKIIDQNIQLNFVDLLAAYPHLSPNKCLHQLNDNWDGISYARAITRSLHYLNGGRIIQCPSNIGIPTGFPSYGSLLKLALSSSQPKQSTDNPIVNTALTNIQKLANTSTSKAGSSTKVSPTFSDDPGSVASGRRTGTTLRIARLSNENQARKLPSKERETWEHVLRKGSRLEKEQYTNKRDFLVNDHRAKLDEIVNNMSRKRKHREPQDRHRGYSQMDNENIGISGYAESGESNDEEDHIPQFRMPEEDLYERQLLSRRNQRRSNEMAVRTERNEKIKRPLRKDGGDGVRSSSMGFNRPTPSPSQIQLPKRIRRDEGRLPSIERSNLLKQRHSDPLRTNVGRNSEPPMRRNTGDIGRGRAMLVKAQKKKAQPITPVRQVFEDFEIPDISLIMKKNEEDFRYMQGRFSQWLKQSSSSDSSDIVENIIQKTRRFKDMILIEEELSLLGSAQAVVTILAKKLNMVVEAKDVLRTMEHILIVPFEKLNVMVIKKYKSGEANASFRECQLQVVLRFELRYIAGFEDKIDHKVNRDFIEDIIKIVNLITAYRKTPPIEDFINDVLVVGYKDIHSKLLCEISNAVNIEVSPLIANMQDDSEEESDRESVSSSVQSLLEVALGDSVSTVGNQRSPHHKARNIQYSQSQYNQHSSFLYMHPEKRKIMIPAAKINSQPTMRPNMDIKPRIAIRSATVARSSPKRVRRNLFDVREPNDPKETKRLLSLTSTSSSFARSPSLFKSPSSKKSYSPHSPARMSPFFRAARSRRKLILDPDNDDVGSPKRWESLDHRASQLRADDFCPETPQTPTYKRRSTNEIMPGSAEAKSVVQESPEVEKSRYSSRPLSDRVNSVSFYSSTGADSQKSRAWEKSGAKLMAARIKDSVDMSSSLTLNDLEFLNESPGSKGVSRRRNSSGNSNCYADDNAIPSSPLPCSSKSLQNLQFHDFKKVQADDHNLNFENMEALMTSEILPTSSDMFNMQSHSNHSSLNTPSKRVQFNLQENLVNTPSPARFPMNGTPRSILKDKDGGSSELP